MKFEGWLVVVDACFLEFRNIRRRIRSVPKGTKQILEVFRVRFHTSIIFLLPVAKHLRKGRFTPHFVAAAVRFEAI